MKKVTIKDIGGEVVKDNAQYLLKDNAFGNNLILSSTFLRANQKTNGHTHAGQEEVYMFIEGGGRMQLDEKEFTVSGGSIVYIQDGVFHRVTAGIDGLYFVCVFDGRRNHE